MNRHKVTQKNIVKVLAAISAQCKEDPKHYGKYYAEALESMLNDLQGEDFFGTEGQCDPRGDQRD